MVLSVAQIYAIARRAGFPPETARRMVAIALKESSGDTRAFNGRGADQSYGLWQINMLGALGPARRAQFGLTSNEDLYDPEINARVAHSLWGGDDRNLERHWAIYSGPGAAHYARYLASLPDFEGAGAGGSGSGAGSFVSGVQHQVSSVARALDVPTWAVYGFGFLMVLELSDFVSDFVSGD